MERDMDMEVEVESIKEEGDHSDHSDGEDSVEDQELDRLKAIQQHQQPEASFVISNAAVDLETLVNNYTGMAKLIRLLHISKHCPALKLDALKMSIEHVEKTYNVPLYQKLHKDIQIIIKNYESLNRGGSGAAPTLPNFPRLNQEWIDGTSKLSTARLEALMASLQVGKDNNDKGEVFRCYNELGEHYLSAGDVKNAQKSFAKSKEYCSSPNQSLMYQINMAKVLIYMNSWTPVLNFTGKVDNLPGGEDCLKAEKEKNIAGLTMLCCAAGLSELHSGRYKQAANSFLGANFNLFGSSEIISQADVGIYTGLCALATFDRQELLKRIISNSSFREFLNMEPRVRDAIGAFYESKYSTCFGLLEEVKATLQLDPYLAPHIEALYIKIRHLGLIQYFTPYASAELNKMAEGFNTTMALLETELMCLISSDQIQGRIDSQNKILQANKVDERSIVFQKAVKMGEEYQRQTKLLMLKSALRMNNIRLEEPTKEKEEDKLKRNHAKAKSTTNLRDGKTLNS